MRTLNGTALLLWVNSATIVLSVGLCLGALVAEGREATLARSGGSTHLVAVGLGIGVRVRVRVRGKRKVRVNPHPHPHPHPHPRPHPNPEQVGLGWRQFTAGVSKMAFAYVGVLLYPEG